LSERERERERERQRETIPRQGADNLRVGVSEGFEQLGLGARVPLLLRPPSSLSLE